MLNEKIPIFLLTITATILATALVIYLTPIKNFNLIEPKINEISPEAFNSLYQANPDKYIFIDVRSEDSYNTIHAIGSISMPLNTLYEQRHILPKNDKEIVLICSGFSASGVGFSYLQHFGFFNIKRVTGGIESWKIAGLPIESTIK